MLPTLVILIKTGDGATDGFSDGQMLYGLIAMQLVQQRSESGFTYTAI